MARKIIEALDVPWVVLLSMDSFYKVHICSTHVLLAQFTGVISVWYPDIVRAEGYVSSNVCACLDTGERKSVVG